MDENPPLFNGIPAFFPISYLLQSSNDTPNFNYFAKMLFTLEGNVFLSDKIIKLLNFQSVLVSTEAAL